MAAFCSIRSVARALRGAAAPQRGMATASYQQALLTSPETRVSTLANGLRVASCTTPHATATVGLYVDAGSRFENAANNGTAHFLEHMAFKGTANRTQTQLELEVENMGAHVNAYTSRESTVYYAKCFSEDVDQAMDLLADILQNSTFDQHAIESERQVIMREMQDVMDIENEVVMDYLHATAYQGHSLGLTILGPEENIKTISRDDLLQYVKTNYTAPRIVLAAAGGVDHDALVASAEKLLGGLSSENTAADLEPSLFTGSQIESRNDDKPLAHFAVAVEGCGWQSPDYFPLMVANSLVGSWDRNFGGGANMSSRLARVTTENQLAHNYMSFHTSYSDTGLWGLYGACERNTVEDFVFEVQSEWMRICKSATDSEVERAKKQLIASMLFETDGTTPLCDQIGRHMLMYGRPMSAVEIDARINAVDASSVRNAAMKYLFDACPAVACVGPTEQFPDYNRLRGQQYWLRT